MPLRMRTPADYQEQYARSISDPEGFWSDMALHFFWRKPHHTTLEWNFEKPSIKWYQGAQLNISENCLDRHLKDKSDQTAILWVPNDPGEDSVSISYAELHQRVCTCASALIDLGIGKGDRVVLYMPMVPELAVAVLACARIGAIHSVVFAGFSAQALADRVDDAQASMIICSDYSRRGAKIIPIKAVVDDAMELSCDSVQHVIVHAHTGGDISWHDHDHRWSELMQRASRTCEATVMESEDPLFILYTSGSTGKPKGVVHSTAGYMVYAAYSFTNVFQYDPGDIYWCTADIGWITGHTYIIYGPLLAGATTMMYEGVPTYPDAGRFWQICEQHRVSQFYTAPTAIRALMVHGHHFPEQYDLSALKVIGTVGEPINEEAWHWYNQYIGRHRAPIVDTWWQTETGGIMITSLPGITDTKPTYAAYPLPGIRPVLVSPEGDLIEENEKEGLLCIDYPWPSMIRTTYGDHERCRQTYFSAFSGKYFTGDGARRDADGRIRVIGRVDDVINVSGHRLGTAEIENAINEQSSVIESAVVAYPHDIKGQGICAFVICDIDRPDLSSDVCLTVRKIIGPVATPDRIYIVSSLPKTRSGKIMRRILRKIACGESEGIGDTSTLLNPECVDLIIRQVEKEDMQ